MEKAKLGKKPFLKKTFFALDQFTTSENWVKCLDGWEDSSPFFSGTKEKVGSRQHI